MRDDAVLGRALPLDRGLGPLDLCPPNSMVDPETRSTTEFGN